MTRTGRSANLDFEHLMGEVTDYGTRAADGRAGQDRRERGGSSGGFSAGLATLVSIMVLAFSGYSFCETVLKQASLRFIHRPW